MTSEAPSLFSHILQAAKQELAHEGFVELALPAEWAARRPCAATAGGSDAVVTPTPAAAGGTQLRSFAAVHPQRGARCSAAHITGPRAEILNMMIYPGNPLRVPVFALEYIAFGGKPRVAVVDLQPAAGATPGGPGDKLTHEVVDALGDVSADIRAALAPGGELPEWALMHFTPACLYSRPTCHEYAGIASDMRLLTTAFHHYLAVWRSEFLARDESGGEESALGAVYLAAYQRHHVQHTPGRPFLTKTFAREWAERYLREFMYPADETLRGRG